MSFVALPGEPLGVVGENLITSSPEREIYLVTPGGSVRAVGWRPQYSAPRAYQAGRWFIFDHQVAPEQGIGDVVLTLIPVSGTLNAEE